MRATATIIKLPKYFPQTNFEALSGRVFNISKVPLLYSSAMLRIVMVGTKKSKMYGAREKNESKLAYPKSRMLVLGNTNKNKPISNKKIIIAIYPVRLLKNCRHSFKLIIHIKSKLRWNKKTFRKNFCQINYNPVQHFTNAPCLPFIETYIYSCFNKGRWIAFSLTIETNCCKPCSMQGLLFYNIPPIKRPAHCCTGRKISNLLIRNLWHFYIEY